MDKGFSNRELQSFFSGILKKKSPALEKKIEQKIIHQHDLENIRQVWQNFAPRLLKDHSVITGYKNKVVQLRADHGIYAQQLQLQSGELCRMLSRESGCEIKKMDVHTGTIYWKSGKSTDIMSQNENMSMKEEHPNKDVLESLIKKAQK